MLQAVVSELWYVEEYDVLALALNGRMKVRKFPLGCDSSWDEECLYNLHIEALYNQVLKSSLVNKP